ncbi:MAG: hypothetical protein ACK53W_12640 [Gemmatimonadota bacterium]
MTERQATKDPGARVDYDLDWSEYLGADTIATSSWTVPAGLTLYAQTATTTVATVWIEGGTAGVDYAITNRVTTAGGRIDERSILIRVRDR